MSHLSSITRRRFLGHASATAMCCRLPSSSRGQDSFQVKPRSVAGIVTAYEHGLHSDVLLGKILDGWKQDGGPGPALRLASMYIDQFTSRDLARAQSRKHHVPIFDTIEGALTLGGDQIAVDGVISIGEHGDYPYNSRQQHLYPRRRFFEGITNAFVKHKRVVPVFSDKHLGPEWDDALWMYRRALELKIPFMAGSSMPVGFRVPDLSEPLGCEVKAAVGIGYSGLDIYGIHALEFLQSQIERRRGGERGVRWVQCLQGEAMWKAFDDGVVSRELLDAAIAATPHQAGKSMRESPGATLFLYQYIDGPIVGIAMLPEYATGTCAALQLTGTPQPLVTRFDERTEPRYPHFAYLLKAIERMVHTGRPSYPVERTLLTSGILDRALVSLADGQRRINTPELAIAYHPADYPHAPRPDLLTDPREGT